MTSVPTPHGATTEQVAVSTLTYAASGVDIGAGEEAVRRIAPLVRSTFGPEVLSELGGFAGLFALPEGKWRHPVLVASTDGVGTKAEVARLAGRYDTIGIDLVAMCVDDVVCAGAEPAFLLDYYSTARLDPEVACQIVSGVAEGCRRAGVALIGGEMAEHPGAGGSGAGGSGASGSGESGSGASGSGESGSGASGSGASGSGESGSGESGSGESGSGAGGSGFDLAGFAVGVVERDEILGADRVRAGDVLLGLASPGLRCNGYSLARRALLDRAGRSLGSPAWRGAAQSLGEELLRPSVIYTPAVLALTGQVAVRALAHITGGGIAGNLVRALPPDCDAVVDHSTWEVPRIFDEVRRAGQITDAEMAQVFNLGIGMIAVVDPEGATRALEVLEGYGNSSVVLGQVTEGSGLVRSNGLTW